MSEDSQEKPKPSKLKLSRDIKSDDDAGKKSPQPEAIEPTPPEAAKPTPPEAMKLKRKAPEETSTEPAEPEEQPEEQVPPNQAVDERTASKNPVQAQNRSVSPQSEEGQGKPTFDTSDPFGKEAKEGAVQKHSLLPSLLVILFLFLFLGVCGYGIWWILKSPANDASLDDPATLASESAGNEASSGPIQKAKDAIAKVPVADVEALNTGDKMDANKAEALPSVDTSGSEVIETTQSTEIPKTTKATAAGTSSAIEQSKKAVSEFLSDMHIGGVRQSANPMILINGTSYLVGDVVHESTGLKFIGLRNERPAFKDQHGIVYLRSF